jgi:hypothetical protein
MAVRRFVLSWAVMIGCIGGAEAGIFNRKKATPPATPPKPPALTPSALSRVDQLIRVLRTDPDERRRLSAVVELSKANIQSHPHIGDALIDTLKQDPSAVVRAGAASALGRVRPMDATVGQALEEASQSDEAPRVRTAAKAALTAYAKAGYRTQAAPANSQFITPAPMTNPRPGLPGAIGPTTRTPAPTRLPATRVVPLQPSQDEPPLADVRPGEPMNTVAPAAPARPSTAPRSLPTTVQPGRKVEPVETTPLTPTPAKPAKPSSDDGPNLNGPG